MSDSLLLLEVELELSRLSFPGLPTLTDNLGPRRTGDPAPRLSSLLCVNLLRG